MILEGIVTTLDAEGRLNIAPMGPDVGRGMERFLLRPFPQSTTFANLRRSREGVLHVTDNVILLAQAAIGHPVEAESRPAEVVAGRILVEAARYYEFRVCSIDDSGPRTTVEVETVAQGHQRELFGFNRAKHAVVEAAILATRVEILPIREILHEFRRLAAPVEKTGGAAERLAYALLLDHVREASRRQGHDPDRPDP